MCKQLFLEVNIKRNREMGLHLKAYVESRKSLWLCCLLVLWWEILEHVCSLREINQYKGKRETNGGDGGWSTGEGVGFEGKRDLTPTVTGGK